MLKIIMFLISAISLALQAQSLHIVSEEVPPLQMFDAQQQPTGVMVDIVNTMLERAELKSAIKLYPWARSYQLALTNKNTVIFSLLRDPTREAKFQWIGQLYTLNSYLATKKISPAATLQTISDAKAYRVGTIRGDLAEHYLIEQGFTTGKNLFISSKYPILWELLFSGRIDAVFTNDLLWRYEVESIGRDPNKLQLSVQVPNFSDKLYIAASLSTDKKIVTALKRALESMKADGSYQAILAKWQL
ncbi:amino acid ABC transporter substrate-binding protein, PAAT family [Colwellia chukchiensis]|uniref:Amino acid ABC transporter substrate-binding protein, PAAT family n=1 Tax=Colwellia chukchiensis TaxID=641665 RepID=A0A1H7SXI5_9GAMM|nr:transporter substrate-binding domain-containing protein [Colwellia chukchiensis]SEL76247.1 amino acid ABC transporter substrate-binding protein, PAAT family [Colwellia chukchiensis]